MPKLCLQCKQPIPETKRKDALYCSIKCRMRSFYLKHGKKSYVFDSSKALNDGEEGRGEVLQ